MKMLVIADPETCLAFALAGIACQPVESEKEVEPILESLTCENAGLVLITEALAGKNRKLVERMLLEQGKPLVVEIPAFSGPVTGRSRTVERLVSLLRR